MIAAALSLTVQILVHWSNQSKACIIKRIMLLGPHASDNNVVTFELKRHCFGLHTCTNSGQAASIRAFDFPGLVNSTTAKPAECRCICRVCS